MNAAVDWRAIRLTEDATIREAMRAIDLGASGLALLCREDDVLLGTVSDGDIRRGLLGDRDMGDLASTVANPAPRTARIGSDRFEMLDVMRRLRLNLLPVTDDFGRVQRIETLTGLLERPRLDNPVFIMAGGFGTRLRPLTADCPKPMLKVGTKPMLEHLVDRFVRLGFHHIYISTHYLPDKIRAHFGDGSQYGAEITYVHEEFPLGTAGALGLLPPDVPQLPLIMINGDVLTNIDFLGLLRHHEERGHTATMCVREYEYQVPFGVVDTSEELVRAMVEKPVHRYHVNAGIYVLDPATAASVTPGTRIDMPTLLERAIADGGRVGTYSSFDYWLDIGRMDDFERAQVDIGVLEAG